MDHDQRIKILIKTFFAWFLELFFEDWAERLDASAVETPMGSTGRRWSRLYLPMDPEQVQEFERIGFRLATEILSPS